jgi:hypothetical protein
MRSVQRIAAEKEGGRHARTLERRRGFAQVAGHVVVERDRNRERLSALPCSHGLEELGGPNHLVVAAKVVELSRKRAAGYGREDLSRGVASGAADAVVDQGNADARRRSARTPADEESLRHLRRITHVRQAIA